eukprot:133047-Amphidinium_carterae.1
MQRARAAGWGEHSAARSGRPHFVPREDGGRLQGGEGRGQQYVWAVPGPQGGAGRGRRGGEGGPGRRRM